MPLHEAAQLLTRHGFSQRVVMPDGRGDVMAIGEGPGALEDRDLIPFHPEAEAGGLFKRLMERVGVTRERFTITNCVWQRPKDNDLAGMGYEQEALDAWWPQLQALIRERKPKAILLLGGTALRQFTHFQSILTTRGYVHHLDLEGHDCPLVATYHPSFLNHGQQHLSGVFIHDVLLALELAAHGWAPPALKTIPTPSISEFQRFAEGYDPLWHRLTFDIETPESEGVEEDVVEEDLSRISFHITRMSFCYDSAIGGISIPWQEPFITPAKQLLASTGPKRSWNGRLFDRPRLERNGCVLNGREYDLMDCLAANTKVRLWDGRVRRICDIVNACDTSLLVGMDADGRLIPVKPCGWHKKQVKQQDWIRIRVDGNRQPIICTPDHNIWTRNGWKEAQSVKPGDAIPIPAAGSPDLIHGTLLGDGAVAETNMLMFTHSLEQAHWFEAKRHHVQGTPVGCTTKEGYIQGRKVRSTEALATSVRVSKTWRSIFYPLGKKIFVPPPSMAALAIWYGDDGNFKPPKRAYTGRMPWRSMTAQGDSWHGGDGYARFCIQGFTKEDQLRVLDYLKSTFGPDVSLHSYPDKTQAVLRRSARDAFFSAIASWLHPSMAYKLPLRHRGKYNGWMEELRPQWAYVESVNTDRSNIMERGTRYCVSVDHSTHRFFAEGGLVHNCWRHLHRTLPASVAFVAPFYLRMPPYKHLAHYQPEWYSAMDAIVEHEIAEGMERDMRQMGQWETYEQHVVDIISHHGVCSIMGRNGLPYSAEAAAVFGKELEQKRLARVERMQEIVPEHLKPVKQKQGLKRPPKDLTGYVQRCFDVPLKALSKDEYATLSTDNDALASTPDDQLIRIKRYALLEEFNPASHLQVKALIKHFGHKVGKDRKSKNETSNDDTLRKLISTHLESPKESNQLAVEAYRNIREVRALSKVLGTYVMGWKPGADGRIHATPGVWGDMFRVSWRDPNIAATVADKKEQQIAAGFRKCVCVSDNEWLIESDWKGMEAVLVGYFAEDPDYMRLARLGVHDYMALHMIGQPIELGLPEGELRDRFAWVKKNHPKIRDDAKHTIHGTNYGMTPFLMAELYEMSRSRAARLQALYFDLFPKVRAWQQRTISQAHSETKLVNAWAYRMDFWNVYKWEGKRYDTLRRLWVRKQTGALGVPHKRDLEQLKRIEAGIASGLSSDKAIARLCYSLGDEAKSAISFLPRDSGAAMLKDALLELEERHQLASRGIIRGCAHDSILGVCRKRDVEWVAEALRVAQERPVERLNGLVIGVEQAIGQSWDKKSMVTYERSTNEQILAAASAAAPAADVVSAGRAGLLG